MPEPESVLWNILRREGIGVKFRRQFSIQNYILDFYSPKAKLAIEIDGDSHFNSQTIIKDRNRDKELKKMGITTLRFTNAEVVKNLEGVFDRIQEVVSTPF
ncbi:MAG: hypothetical protein UY73_C0041G0002 [Parcubacteria group bacterium GW2011_GWA2_52_8]|nr:MAG: hypothetical protein UY73_C0041G0002 [Parcubacteria group bacterium GW2011_GWA2_52_8]